MLRIFRGGRQATDADEPGSHGPEELTGLAAERAENFFTVHGLSCSEAVLLVLNQGFGGGLSAEVCLGLGSGFGGGIGNAGSVCGSLSGAVMALGLFLGPAQPGGLGKKEFRRLVGDFYERFRERSGAVNCRELIADFRHRRGARRRFCGGLTGWIAGETARLILTRRPELGRGADLEFLKGRESRWGALLARFSGRGVAAGLEKND